MTFNIRQQLFLGYHAVFLSGDMFSYFDRTLAFDHVTTLTDTRS